MEKIIMPVWKHQSVSNHSFKRQLLDELGITLTTDNAIKSLKICIVDELVEPAAPYRMTNIMTPPFDAAIILWIDAASQINNHKEYLEKYFSSYMPYVVAESDRLPLDTDQVRVGHKTEGMNEIVFLQKPDRLTYDEWLSIWQDSHTQIAIDTQSTYGYRQNLVVRKLVDDAPHIDAIIEENFPEKAIHSRMGFYDADDDEALYKAREKEMVDSCVRFIDFDKIDCIPTSEYVIK